MGKRNNYNYGHNDDYGPTLENCFFFPSNRKGSNVMAEFITPEGKSLCGHGEDLEDAVLDVKDLYVFGDKIDAEEAIKGKV